MTRTMTGTDFIVLLPLLLLGGTSVAVMLAIAVRRSHRAALLFTLAGLAAAFGALWAAAPLAPRQVTALLILDRYALFYMGLIIAATFVVAILLYGYLERHEGNKEEAYVLLLLAALGSAVLVASSHFASFFLGLEILSVSLYASIAYLRTRSLPLEAGVKYLVLAAASAAFLLFGMALIYADMGTMEFARMAALISAKGNAALLIPGLVLVLVGIGFKLGVVPFHLWTPDVYEGAPAPVAAFIATVSKGAMFALLLRYFGQAGMGKIPSLVVVLWIIAIASMIAGNLLALLQNNVKRILGYSSIAHLGYLLVAFEAGGEWGAAAATFYLVAYFVTTLGAFGVVTLLSGEARDADRIEDYRGLFWRRPALGAVFTAMLLSLAGIPPTAGFLAKFYVVGAGASSAIWSLIIILAVTSVIGLFYYIRIVVALYADSSAPPEKAPALLPSIAAPGTILLAVLTAVLLWLGVFPSCILDMIHIAIAGFM